jgi:hypothetical protein
MNNVEWGRNGLGQYFVEYTRGSAIYSYCTITSKAMAEEVGSKVFSDLNKGVQPDLTNWHRIV